MDERGVSGERLRPIAALGNAAEAPSDILIGATLPLSGRFTPMAGTFDRLCQSWAKLVNAQGGLYVKAYDKKLPVKFIIYDDKSEPGRIGEVLRAPGDGG